MSKRYFFIKPNTFCFSKYQIYWKISEKDETDPPLVRQGYINANRTKYVLFIVRQISWTENVIYQMILSDFNFKYYIFNYMLMQLLV